MKPLRILSRNLKMVVPLLAAVLLFKVAAANAQSQSVPYMVGNNTGDPANPAFLGLTVRGSDGNWHGSMTHSGALRYGTAHRLALSEENGSREYAWRPRLFAVPSIESHTTFQPAFDYRSGLSLTSAAKYDPFGNFRLTTGQGVNTSELHVTFTTNVDPIWNGGPGN